MTNTNMTFAATCTTCGFTTNDMRLLTTHSCDIQENGGHCEDYPACGHEWGDCNGLKYGSDEAIKEHARQHYACDHEAGHYPCENLDEPCDDEDCEVTGTCTC